MPRLCALGAALLAGASAGGYDWEEDMQRYAGGFYGGGMDGEFSGYAHRYAGNASASADQYAGNYSQDRLAQVQQYQRQYEAQYAGGYEAQYSGAGAAALLEEAAPAANATDPALHFFTAEVSAAQRAQAAIAELRSWNAMQEQDLKDKNFSITAAKAVATRVQTMYEAQRERLQQDFNSALRNMSKAGSAGAAKRAAKHAMRELRHLDHKEAKAMRETLRDITRASGAQVRGFWRTARTAAHQVYKLGMEGARAQIHQGLNESVYERTMLVTERFSEGLRGEAEEAYEKSESLVERQFDSVKPRLEAIMEGLHHRAVAAHETREERLRDAERAAKRPAALAEAPEVFLARGSSQDSSGALIAPLACVAMLAGTVALLAVRSCRSSGAVERPLLG
mmetsp:Transcript_104534/g.278141  ORF Transcript_104534/g.278141 Transcript_104534/m.278141 type:complete len:395 (-) Transcript_104534:107-1291(-)